MSDDTDVELSMMFATMHPNAPQEEEAGNPSDLFACHESGHFFTVQNMDIQASARSLNTSKSFICPSCLSTPLTIAPPQKRGAGVALATCSACKWDSANSKWDSADKLTTMVDLIHQANQPYPWLYPHFRALKAMHDPDTLAMNSKKRASERHIQRLRTTSLQNVLNNCVNEMSPTASTFTAKQETHERNVFKSFVPSSDIAPVRNGPRHDIEALLGEIHSNELLPVSQRRAAGLSMRRQLGPSQNIRPPHMSVKSPFTFTTVNAKWESADFESGNNEWTGAYVLPKMRIFMKKSELNEGHEVDSGGKVDVGVDVKNDKELGVCLRFRNMAEQRQAKELWLGAREEKRIAFKKFVWTISGVEHMGWMEEFCDKLVQLQLEVRYDFTETHVREMRSNSSKPKKLERLARHAWRVCIFARHKLSDCHSYPDDNS